LIEEGDTFPADLCFLTSSAEEANCFIKTSSLDGEKNLKKRIQIKDLDVHFPAEKKDAPKFKSATGKIQIELPNRELDRFNGTMSIEGKDFSIDKN
jgi:phospholipid-translocating ATPase